MTRWPIGCWDTPGSAESETRGDPRSAWSVPSVPKSTEINRNQQKSASILQVLSFTNFRGIHRSSSSTCWITYFLTNCPTFLTNHVLPTDRAWHQRNPRLRWPSPISLEQTFTKTQRKTLDTQHISTYLNINQLLAILATTILHHSSLMCDPSRLRVSGSQDLRVLGLDVPGAPLGLAPSSTWICFKLWMIFIDFSYFFVQNSFKRRYLHSFHDFFGWLFSVKKKPKPV